VLLPRRANAFIRGSLVAGLAAGYVTLVFGMSAGSFWRNGLGDWGDPYFINALLEHWYRSATSLSSPVSPPMFHPVPGTLGYSHGLVLYAPFYVLIRPFTHPFLAWNLALAAVVWLGMVCTHLLIRRLGVPFAAALALAAFFATSRNVINEATAVWSQRASVFLLPPILLLLLESARQPAGVVRTCLAALAGLLAALLLVQDSYTGQFALLFGAAALAAAAAVRANRSIAGRIVACWRDDARPATRAALLTALAASGWACFLRLAGGVTWNILGVRVASNDWRWPAAIGAVALAVLVSRRGGVRGAVARLRERPWLLAAGGGAVLGGLTSLWIYLDAFLRHGGFARADLVAALVPVDPSAWRRGVVGAWRAINAYETGRPFALALLVALVPWMPGVGTDRSLRRASVWLLVLSGLVLAAPLLVGGMSVWTGLAALLPGFAAIRDPKRIIYVYELAVVLAAAALLRQAALRPAVRVAVVALVCLLLAADWNRNTFSFARPNGAYDRVIAAPIDVHPSCRSFAVAGESRNDGPRSGHTWAVYGVDALFVALRLGMPTLNGYSAWAPDGWDLAAPLAPGYQASVTAWAARHGLTGVCLLDMDARTMAPLPQAGGN
jgi:hypothetical protein